MLADEQCIFSRMFSPAGFEVIDLRCNDQWEGMMSLHSNLTQIWTSPLKKKRRGISVVLQAKIKTFSVSACPDMLVWAVKEPFLRKVNMEKRLGYSKLHQKQTHNGEMNPKCVSMIGERFNKECLQQPVKHGKGCVMVGDCF